MRGYRLFISCTLLVTACTTGSPSSTQPPTKKTASSTTLRPLSPPVELAIWRAYRARAQGAPKAGPRRQADIIHTLATFHRAEVSDSSPNSLQLASRQWAYVQATSPATYVQLGRHLGLKMTDAIAKLVGAYKDPLARIRTVHDDPLVKEYVDLGGLFLQHAAQAGLLKGNRLETRDLAFIQALFMRRWVESVPARADAWSYLTPAEHRWYLRYLVEARHSASSEARLRALDQLRKVSGYPANHNLAVVYAQQGQLERATHLLKGLRDPAAQKLRREIEAKRKP